MLLQLGMLPRQGFSNENHDTIISLIGKQQIEAMPADQPARAEQQSRCGHSSSLTCHSEESCDGFA
jgi:hypothetical protein